MPHKMMNSQIADVLHDNRLSIEARHLKTVLMHNIRQMSVVAFSTVHVKYLTTVISTNIK